MTRHYDKQQIAELLSKFMAGETNVAEENVLAQYFRTHEVDDEWAEYKEMFALFDSGQVDIELERDTSKLPNNADDERIRKLPMAVKEKPKIVVLRWLVAGIAACIALLLVFHLGRNATEQTPLMVQHTVAADSIQSQLDVISPTLPEEQPLVAQATPVPPTQPTAVKRRVPKPKVAEPMPKAADSSAAESLAKCIARLEAEMENLDDSVNSEQLEKLIAADVHLQQMVNRIIGKQVEQAINEIQRDSTANYINF